MTVTLTLPGRAQAEKAIDALMKKGRLGFVLAVVGTNIPRLNEQLGYQAGDHALESLARRLAGPGTSRELFRWSASAFVIIPCSLRKITDHAGIDYATTALFAAWPNDNAASLFDRIDGYITARLACGEAA